MADLDHFVMCRSAMPPDHKSVVVRSSDADPIATW